MKPKSYPCFRYHDKHGALVIKDEKHWDKLTAEEGHGWGSHPDKIKKASALNEDQENEEQDPPEELELETEPNEESIKSELIERGYSKKNLKGKTLEELKAMLAD